MTDHYRAALQQKEREFQLVLALDSIRDSFDDQAEPETMFAAIVDLLKIRFEAQACGLFILAENDDEIECAVGSGMSRDAVIELCRRAVDFSDWSALTDWRWKHLLGIQISLDGKRLGALVLARQAPAFEGEELTLLKVAESQVDSATMQARTIWKLKERQRQLEAIYQIDHLNDASPQESDLIDGFTLILGEHFRAELCIIILSHADSGELVTRGIMDRSDLPTAALEEIQSACARLQQVEIIPTPPGAGTLSLLAAPLIVAGERLGAVVVGRKTKFLISDTRLLNAMMTQMDSATATSRVRQQLADRNRELEFIYRIDRIRDEERDFDALLLRVLRELCSAVSGEAGYIMLYNDREQQLELKASTVEGLLSIPEYREAIQAYSRHALETAGIVYSNTLGGTARSIISVPLILHENIIGVFGTLNSTKPQGFSREDRRILNAITSQIDTAIFERLENRRMRNVLSRSVDPNVLEQLLARTDASILGGERVILSVLFADLRGSTEWAERTSPEELVETLNLFLGLMTEIIFRHGGTLDKFVGDQVIGLFGSPLYIDDHAYRAVQAALEMQSAQEALRNDLARRGREVPPMGVSISSGEAIAGEIGAPNRTAFTAIGRIVNLGSRLCSSADAGQILISQSTYELVEAQCEARPLSELVFKGFRRPIPVYELLSLKD